MRFLFFALALFCLISNAFAFDSSSYEQSRSAVFQAMKIVHSDFSVLSQGVHSASSITQTGLKAFDQINVNSFSSASVSSHSGFHSMVSTQCQTAVVALNATLYSSACLAFSGVINSNPLNNPSQLNADLTTLCTSSCLTNLASASASVASSCQSTDAAAFTANVYQLLTLTNTLCIKDNTNGQYCFAEFFNSFAPLQNGLTSVTTAQLQAFCTPCTYAVLNGFVAYGGLSAGVSLNVSLISVVCSIDPVTNQYCLVELASTASVFSSFSSSNIPTITNAQFEPLCSSCTTKFLAYVNSPLTSAVLSSLCLMNGNNFCFVADINALSPLQGTLTGNTNQQQACSAFSQFVNSAGCCVNALTTMINAISASTGQTSTTTFDLTAAFSACGITNPGTCTATSYTGSFSFVLNNFAFTYYQSNPTQASSAIKADVAFNLGIPSSQVSITASDYMSNGASTGVTVQATVTFTNTLQSTTAVGTFNTNVAAGNFPMTNVAQLGASSRIAPASPVATSTTNSQSSSNAPTYTYPSPAAKHAPLSVFMVVLAVAIAMIFNRK